MTLSRHGKDARADVLCVCVFVSHACVYVWVCICVCTHMCVHACRDMSEINVACFLYHVLPYFLFMCICGDIKMTAVAPSPEEAPGVTGRCEQSDADSGN